jgi:hypothetical protein
MREFLRAHYGLEVERIVIEQPPKVEFGEYALPLAFELAKKFNDFYHACPVIDSPEPIRSARLALVAATRTTLATVPFAPKEGAATHLKVSFDGRENASFFFSTDGCTWRAVGGTGVLTLDQRVLIRLASTYAIHQAKAVADMTHHAGGATSIFIESAFDRGFRDIHAVTQQLQGRQSHFETVGRFLFGLEPDTTFL